MDTKPRYGRGTWILVLLDVMAVAWMVTAGRWLDGSGVLSVVTLGGHHSLVAALATASFLLLAGLAVSTEGFSHASTAELVLQTVAVVLTVVALAGLFSIVLLAMFGGTFVGLLGKLFRR